MGDATQVIVEVSKKLNWELLAAIGVSVLGFITKFFWDPERGKIKWGKLITGLSFTVLSAVAAFYCTSGIWRFFIGYFAGLLSTHIISETYKLWPFFIQEIKVYVKRRSRK